MRDISFEMPKAHSDDSPVNLDADTIATVYNLLQKTYSAIGYLSERVRDNDVIVSIRHNTLGVSKSYLKQIDKLLGGDDDQEEIDLALRQLRAANTEIDRLQKAMSESVADEAMGHRLNVLYKNIQNWWHSLGFGYAKGQCDFGWGDAARYAIQFHTDIDVRGDTSLFEEKPVTAAQTQAEIIAKLLTNIDVFQETSNYHFLDTPRNRDFICEQITSRFVGSRVWEIRSCKFPQKNLYLIRHVEAHIPLASIESKVNEQSQTSN